MTPAFVSLGPGQFIRQGQKKCIHCERARLKGRIRCSLASRGREDLSKLLSYAQRSMGATCAAALLLASTAAHADIPMELPSSVLYDEAAVVQRGSEQLFTKAMENVKKNDGYSVRFVLAKSIPYGESPDDFAKDLYDQWQLGPSDVLFVASPKLARAGVFIGEDAKSRLTPEIAQSICNDTYAVKAGQESYGSALLDVSNRLIPVLGGGEDPGPPDLAAKEVVQTYKTKAETSNEKQKYITVVGAVLVIAFVAPLVQTYWYVKDD